MFRWLIHTWIPERYQGRTAFEWYSSYRHHLDAEDDLASAVTTALRQAVSHTTELSATDLSDHLLSVLVTTHHREGVRCLAGITIGLQKRNSCESGLLVALNDSSELVRRTVAFSLVELNSVRGLAAVVAGHRHGHGVRTHAAKKLREHGSQAYDAIPGLLALIRYRKINWRSHAAAADALASIGEPAIPWLRELLRSGEPHLRYYAALALKQIGRTPDLRTAIDKSLTIDPTTS